MTTPHQPPDPGDDSALDVVVVGGCGHVGLPLAVALASRGLDVGDLRHRRRRRRPGQQGELPFMEDGAGDVLQTALADGRLTPPPTRR